MIPPIAHRGKPLGIAPGTRERRCRSRIVENPAANCEPAKQARRGGRSGSECQAAGFTQAQWELVKPPRLSAERGTAAWDGSDSVQSKMRQGLGESRVFFFAEVDGRSVNCLYSTAAQP